MSAPYALTLLSVLVYATGISATPQDTFLAKDDELIKKVELYDGIVVKIPEQSNDTQRLFSVEVATGNGNSVAEGRGKKQKKLMERILPMFIMPFLIQSAIVPMFLSMLKFMLFKAMMIGKLALGFVILNAFRNHNVVKGRDTEMAQIHYGYQGNEMYEYGAYINH